MGEYQYKYTCSCPSSSSISRDNNTLCFPYGSYNNYCVSNGDYLGCGYGTNITIYSNSSYNSYQGCSSFSYIGNAGYSLSCVNRECTEIIDSGGGGNIEETLPAPEISETLGVGFPNYTGNIISSVNGATVTLDSESLAVGVGQPMFFWYGQLLNVTLKFFPVFVVVSMFWLIYAYLKNLGKKNSLDSKTSLDNK